MSLRDSLASYLFPSPSLHVDHPVVLQNLSIIAPPTPPSSLPRTVDIPIQPDIQNHGLYTFPLTPESDSSLPSQSIIPNHVSTDVQANSVPCEPAEIPLLTSLFPTRDVNNSTTCYPLEIVTPPSHKIEGFILDRSDNGRSAYIHLVPPQAATSSSEQLSANFSEVLRPHDPSRIRSGSVSGGTTGLTTSSHNLDLRDSLTALLDLAHESLRAKRLILVLDRVEGMAELLYSLMYAGGQVITPGVACDGWQWDSDQWVLVGMEL